MTKVQPVPPTSWKKVGTTADQFINRFYPKLLLNMDEFPVIDFLEFKLKELGFEWEVVELPHGLEAEVDFDCGEVGYVTVPERCGVVVDGEGECICNNIFSIITCNKNIMSPYCRIFCFKCDVTS